MKTIDQTREIVSPISGGKLTVNEALCSASIFLRNSDTKCAYVRSARALLDAALTEIDTQRGTQP